MSLSKEDRKYVLNEFIRHISHIQDLDYQNRVWIQGQGPECQGFDDAVCDFFDIGDPILNEYKEFNISDSQYRLLQKLRDAFSRFTDDNDVPETFINTPEWKKIRTLAKAVLEAFNYPNT